jgi:hypothetical protein
MMTFRNLRHMFKLYHLRIQYFNFSSTLALVARCKEWSNSISAERYNAQMIEQHACHITTVKCTYSNAEVFGYKLL